MSDDVCLSYTIVIHVYHLDVCTYIATYVAWKCYCNLNLQPVQLMCLYSIRTYICKSGTLCT